MYVGRLEPNKRVDWLLEVLPRVPEATLRRLFAVVLLVTAAQIAWRTRGKRP